MLTTCPECRTSFRVTQEQLGLRRGLVRCGSCGVVFNAYDSLLAELVSPPMEEADAPGAMVEVPELHEQPSQEAVEEALENLHGQMHADPSAERVNPVVPSPPPETESDQALVEATRDSPVAAQKETSESILLSELPNRVIKPPRNRRQQLRWALFSLAAVVLGVLLLLQLTLFLRAEIAASVPAARPMLKSLCKPFGCGISLPRQLDKSAIAASSLEHDAETPSRARLTLLLVNRTSQPQTWPHIVLTLTDVRDAPVAQRVFTPVEYLPKEVIHNLGMPASTEREIRLDLDTGNLAATGYALDLAYR
jgi:predicted Zn finger-like uncharacterized protein